MGDEAEALVEMMERMDEGHEQDLHEPELGPSCPNCKLPAELKDSAIIYNGTSYGLVWICPNFPACQCYVGVHEGTEKAKGTLCGPETRFWRKRAHQAFDQLWKGRKMARGAAYAKLSKAFGGVPIHIGESDEARCKEIIDWAEAQLKLREGKHGN